MLFNTLDYFLIFLPLTVIIYYFCLKRRLFGVSKLWLLVASMFFYCYWNFDYFWLLAGSILVNFVFGSCLSSAVRFVRKVQKKCLLVAGIFFNIGLLGYYKYVDFLIGNINFVFSQDFPFQHIVLPLAISFFTFQQIAYLVDSYRGLTREYDLVTYAVFVSFFPQLIAGPIVHHGDLISQFYKAKNLCLNYKNMTLGLLVFCIGLIKKALIADKFAQWVSAGYANVESLNIAGGWLIPLCYTFQLYFDFSGYCDMAIGSALFFNIRLPINFNSPYKSLSIQEFWRRWHMTLSGFLRDYLYFPIGGSKKGNFRTYVNLFFLFVVTGIWHGATNMFVVWGMLNGAAILLHRFFKLHGGHLPKIPAWFLTFMFFNLSLVFFRAPDFDTALAMYAKMIEFEPVLNGSFGSFMEAVKASGLSGNTLTYLMIGFIVILCCKNTSEISDRFEKTDWMNLRIWKYRTVRITVCGIIIPLFLFYLSIMVISSNYTEFIYFNF